MESAFFLEIGRPPAYRQAGLGLRGFFLLITLDFRPKWEIGHPSGICPSVGWSTLDFRPKLSRGRHVVTFLWLRPRYTAGDLLVMKEPEARPIITSDGSH
jgi:hypothetical protein